MSATQILAALIPLVLLTVAVVVGALLEPWRVRRNRPGRRGSGTIKR